LKLESTDEVGDFLMMYIASAALGTALELGLFWRCMHACMLCESTEDRARKIEIEILEKEILCLKGRKRETALKSYHKLLLPLADETVYFMRS